DGTPNNLSSPNDSWTNRTFTINGDGSVTYSGTHDFDSSNNEIQLAPYNQTTNPGGVYIMAGCQVPPTISGTNTPRIDPRDCKYDMFKINPTSGPTTLSLIACKFNDLDGSHVQDPGEPTIADWPITATINGLSVQQATDDTGCTIFDVPMDAAVILTE